MLSRKWHHALDVELADGGLLAGLQGDSDDTDWCGQ